MGGAPSLQIILREKIYNIQPQIPTSQKIEKLTNGQKRSKNWSNTGQI